MWGRQPFQRASFSNYPMQQPRGYANQYPNQFPVRNNQFPVRNNQFPVRNDQFPVRNDDSIYDMMYQQPNNARLTQKPQRNQLPRGITKAKSQSAQKNNATNQKPLGVKKKKTRPNQRIRERQKLAKLQAEQLKKDKNVKKISVTPKKSQKVGSTNKKNVPGKPKERQWPTQSLMQQAPEYFMQPGPQGFMQPEPQEFMQPYPQNYMYPEPQFMQPHPQDFMEPPPQRFIQRPSQPQRFMQQQPQPQRFRQRPSQRFINAQRSQQNQLAAQRALRIKKLTKPKTNIRPVTTPFKKKTRPNRRIRAEIKKRKLIKEAVIAAGKAKPGSKFESKKYRAILDIPFTWPIIESEDEKLIIDEFKRAFEENVCDQFLAHMRKKLFRVNPTWNVGDVNEVIKNRVESLHRYKYLDVDRLLANIDSARIKKLSFYIKFAINAIPKAFEQDSTDDIELIMLSKEEDYRFLPKHILLFCKLHDIPACRIGGLESIICQLCDVPQTFGVIFKKQEDNPLQEFIDFVKGKVPDILTEIPDLDSLADVLIPVLKKNAKETTSVRPDLLKAKTNKDDASQEEVDVKVEMEEENVIEPKEEVIKDNKARESTAEKKEEKNEQSTPKVTEKPEQKKKAVPTPKATPEKQRRSARKK